MAASGVDQGGRGGRRSGRGRAGARWLLATAWLTLGWPARPALACGPFFSPTLLEGRGEALLGLGRGWLALELPRLATTTLPACALSGSGGRNGQGGQRMPASPDTVDGRLYAQAAAALDAGRQDDARAAFVAILQLPPTERRGFGVAAAYMLGRLATPLGDTFFEQARDLAREGAADPLCLARDSLGEQGRQAMQRGDGATAVRAYAEQAATGDAGAVVSLRMVGHRLADDPQALMAALREPLVQGLMAAMAHASGEAWEDGGHGWVSEDEATSHNLRLLWTMASLPLQRGQDRLAGAAWRAGEYELAEHFAAQSERALALLVRAKAAIRHGEAGKLRERLDAAARAASDEGDARLRGQIEQDRAILALSEGRYQDAGAIAVALGDMALATYIVERVLALDEAQAFLARKDVRRTLQQWTPDEDMQRDRVIVEASRPGRPAAGDGRAAGKQPGSTDAQLALGITSLYGDGTWQRPTLPQLTAVLARRLVRQGHGEAAASLLPAAEAERARTYQRSLALAERSRGVDRAEALYRAAMALLPDGMDLIGTELGPDWTMVGGSYASPTSSFGRELPETLFRPVHTPGDPRCAERWSGPTADASVCVVSADEARRLAASEPPGRSGGYRYHYRARAAELLWQAAASVPTHTQAFGALLCAAYQPVRDRVPDWPERPYAAYVRHGAYVAGLFTERSCPEPAFARARTTPAPSWQWQLRRRLRWAVRDAMTTSTTALHGTEHAASLDWLGELGRELRDAIPYEWRIGWRHKDDEG